MDVACSTFGGSTATCRKQSNTAFTNIMRVCKLDGGACSAAAGVRIINIAC
jgi:hypothetical protein